MENNVEALLSQLSAEHREYAQVLIHNFRAGPFEKKRLAEFLLDAEMAGRFQTGAFEFQRLRQPSLNDLSLLYLAAQIEPRQK
jgi:hypothetical protein